MQRRYRGLGHSRPARLRPIDYTQPILCLASYDDGDNWEAVGQVDQLGGFDNANLHEPHVAQLPGGRLVGVIGESDAKKLFASIAPSLWPLPFPTIMG